MKTKSTLPRLALFAATAIAFGALQLGSAPDAQAQGQTTGPNGPFNSVVVQPKPPVNTPIPPPTTRPDPPKVVIKDTPPPVVVVTRPDPIPPPTPKMPDRPGMFMNMPSDMRSLTQFGAITSIDRLLTAPGVIDLTLPRQAVPNMFENRPVTASIAAGRAKDVDLQDAKQSLESAKPLI